MRSNEGDEKCRPKMRLDTAHLNDKVQSSGISSSDLAAKFVQSKLGQCREV